MDLHPPLTHVETFTQKNRNRNGIENGQAALTPTPILGTLASLFMEVVVGQTSPSMNGTNRSRLRRPGRSPFNPSRMNKAVECFEGTSVEQTQHVQSLTDILQKIVPKHDIINKQWVPGHWACVRGYIG